MPDHHTEQTEPASHLKHQLTAYPKPLFCWFRSVTANERETKRPTFPVTHSLGENFFCFHTFFKKKEIKRLKFVLDKKMGGREVRKKRKTKQKRTDLFNRIKKSSD